MFKGQRSQQVTAQQRASGRVQSQSQQQSQYESQQQASYRSSQQSKPKSEQESEASVSYERERYDYNELKMLRYVPRFVKSGRRSQTHEYDQVAERRGMIVRRGEYFYLDVEFDRSLDDYDLFSVVVSTETFGAERLERQWLLKEKPKRFSDEESYHCPIQIRSTIHYQGSRKLTVVFTSPADTITAKYWVTKLSCQHKAGNHYSFDLKFCVSVIYNAFNPDDAVYMEDEAERDEYVMEDYGIVYCGSSRRIGGRSWYFGQYDDPVLDCVYYLLAKSDLPLEQWGDPVQVARTLSALVNSQDDDGVLTGNWSGDYSGGVTPTEWKGSLRIIRQYYETRQPVRYGQCWVFSAVLTALARAIGIPARSVTNFDSAHDTNCNMIIDCFFNENNEPVASPDSIWNFHVWNDMWMRRADLSEEGKFDGWQAVDATPQERSEGVFRTGPCSLAAIKEGMVQTDYDAPFVFAEVNACVKHWTMLGDGNKREIYSNPRHVGKYISTKAVGSQERQDVTFQYKYAEGSREEDNAFRNATNSKKLENIGNRTDDTRKSRSLKISIESEDFYIYGKDIIFSVQIANSSRGERKPQVGIAAILKKYNGKAMKELAKQASQIVIKGNDTTKVELSIPASEYSSIAGHEISGVEIVAVVMDGNEKLVEQQVIGLFNPDMFIEISGDVKQNKQFHFKCTFNNCLPFTLEDAVFSIEGPGLRGESLDKRVGNVEPDNDAKCSITLEPRRAGQRKFIASFNSKQLKGITLEYPVFVEEDPDHIVEDEIIPESSQLLQVAA